MDELAGFGALRAHGGGGCSFGAGSAVIPAAGNVLGGDYNPGRHAVIAGCGAHCFSAVGAMVATYFGLHALAFGTSVFILGLVCALGQSDRSAYRFGGITLAIVMLVPRTGPAWQIAFHRFAEVSIGIPRESREAQHCNRDVHPRLPVP